MELRGRSSRLAPEGRIRCIDLGKNSGDSADLIDYEEGRKEHIANMEQMGYIKSIGSILIPVRRPGKPDVKPVCPAGESRT
ncbi:hypothetical protein V1291_001257 [Nitrobacteraceae bacterium AZCC 1564]